MSSTSWAFNGMINDGCGYNYNSDLIEQIVLKKDHPPYQKKPILPTSQVFIEGVKDFVAKTKSFFSMKNLNTKTYQDVLGSDRRAANDTFWQIMFGEKNAKVNEDMFKKGLNS